MNREQLHAWALEPRFKKTGFGEMARAKTAAELTLAELGGLALAREMVEAETERCAAGVELFALGVIHGADSEVLPEKLECVVRACAEIAAGLRARGVR